VVGGSFVADFPLTAFPTHDCEAKVTATQGGRSAEATLRGALDATIVAVEGDVRLAGRVEDAREGDAICTGEAQGALINAAVTAPGQAIVARATDMSGAPQPVFFVDVRPRSDPPIDFAATVEPGLRVRLPSGVLASFAAGRDYGGGDTGSGCDPAPGAELRTLAGPLEFHCWRAPGPIAFRAGLELGPNAQVHAARSIFVTTGGVHVLGSASGGHETWGLYANHGSIVIGGGFSDPAAASADGTDGELFATDEVVVKG
jgi:hypothetical protein